MTPRDVRFQVVFVSFERNLGLLSEVDAQLAGLNVVRNGSYGDKSDCECNCKDATVEVIILLRASLMKALLAEGRTS